MKKISVACIIVDDANRVLIAHRNQTGQMGGRWEFPGGKVEDGELPEAAIVREMQEEFGVRVRVGARIGETVFTHNAQDVQLIAYEVFLLPGEKEKKWTLSEHTEINWVACDAVPLRSFVDSDLLLYPQVKQFLDAKR
ncbi:MAG TPA: NUDIX domain-containing protein [Candidatus Treponema faecavium]|nr:NUDIX domain-containing protein [Candidatus Treponema faecavium]